MVAAIYLVAILVTGDILGLIRLIAKKKSRFDKGSREYLRIKMMVVYLFILGSMTVSLPILDAEGIRLGLTVNMISGLGVAIGFYVSKRLMKK